MNGSRKGWWAIKVLIVGVYRDFTGWGSACTDYVLALDAAGVDVVCRPLKLNSTILEPCKRILELESKDASGCDAVILHCLPHHMEYNAGCGLNIGLFAWETSNFSRSVWASRLNMMDAVWVVNNQQAIACMNSGVKRPISVMPHATDITRFQQSYKPLEMLKPLEGTFKFYFVGEMTRRKNLAAALRAFHTEFEPSEPVSFVIKTSVPGQPPEEGNRRVREFCDEIKRGLKLYPGNKDFYKQEVIITDRITDKSLLRLHESCDCFVCPSYGEAWGIGAFDAMAMGKTPIVTRATGFLDYLSDGEAWLVQCVEDDVFGVDESFGDLYTAREQWHVVNVKDLRRCMREAYEQDELRRTKSENGIRRAYDFTYEEVGARMRKALEHGGALA